MCSVSLVMRIEQVNEISVCPRFSLLLLVYIMLDFVCQCAAVVLTHLKKELLLYLYRTLVSADLIEQSGPQSLHLSSRLLPYP